jgi:DNA-3-methyladenine glycosylase I
MEIRKNLAVFQNTFAFYKWNTYNNPKPLKKFPTTTPLSDTSTDLKRGFKFVGSTVVYAYLQATGLINDHVSDCWKISKQRCCIQ